VRVRVRARARVRARVRVRVRVGVRVTNLGARGRESARPAAASACRRAAGLEAPSAVIRILPDASGAVMVAGSTPPCAGKSSGRAAAAPGLRGGSCAVSWLGLGSGLGLG